ncbi:anti-repressor SinI family protein [Bacillus sp. SA1-12]|nr:anti-repressor SinI family protein [Bacillus sp. SA1-12]
MCTIESLDQEWVELILQALEIGITAEQIRHFFHNPPRLA